MDPATGDVYRLREQLIGDAQIGDRIDLDGMRARMREIVDEQATEDEARAAAAEQLVRVSENAARKLILGDREQRRRKRRRRS